MVDYVTSSLSVMVTRGIYVRHGKALLREFANKLGKFRMIIYGTK